MIWPVACFTLHLLLIWLSFSPRYYSPLFNDKHKQHLWLGLTTSLALLWSIEASIQVDLPIHFLGITAVSLILGHHLALLAGTVAYVAVGILKGLSLTTFLIGFLPNVGIPILISFIIYVFAYHKLPRHFFVYVFVCAFLAGALSIFGMMLTNAALLWLFEGYSWQILFEKYLIVSPLMLLPEAMLNGMIITLTVVYTPHWVRSFYDDEYLNK